ncbi:aldolase [Guyanagaster necrorhizus]|uniref:Aldolase n=1 Tax=Guyanagaster necrorhizus TaxID=856835 RepID=A0A9P8AUU7_9AGAR|nr:aldolase [Guyanagaster necrorhizus MCA 3950]KAG7448625.1 aldolase [Guyanagaster necrorhizus MCA 3950]
MPSPPPFGYYVPAVCFFDEKEDLDARAIKSHILRVAKGGVAGIIVQGTNGEAQHLSHEERKQTICLTRQILDTNGFSNIVILAGCGAQSARETQKLCVDTKEAGADYALILSPSTFPPQMSVPNVIRFHLEVADASPTVTAGLDLDSDALVTLAKHPNIVGAKLTCGNIAKLLRIASSVPASEFAVLAGKADFVLPGLLAGSRGCITALSNLTPKLHGKLFYLWKVAKGEEAMRQQATMGHADWALQKLGGIGAYGYGTGKVRTPLKEVTDESLQGNKHYEMLIDLIRMEERLDSKL